MSKKSPTAVGMYGILDRDPEAFIDYLPEMEDDELDDLWLMLTTPNPNSDLELNKLGADLVKPHFEKRQRHFPLPISTKYEVLLTIEVPVRLVVKADDLDEANRLAQELAVRLPFLKERGPFSTGSEKGFSARATAYELLDPADTLTKFSTATCAGCGVQTLKVEWGPGWMHCPRCRRQRTQADPE